MYDILYNNDVYDIFMNDVDSSRSSKSFFFSH